MTRKSRPKNPENPINILRAVMKRERDKRGISQSKLAHAMEISRSYLTQLESGKRHIYWDLWLSWCSNLRVSPSYIIDQWSKMGGFEGMDKDRMKECHIVIDEMAKYGLHIEIDNVINYFKSLVDAEKAVRRKLKQQKEFKALFAYRRKQQ